MLIFRHPKYYKELRKLRNKSDRVISGAEATAEVERAPGQGLKQQGSSNKQQAEEAQATETQASSSKR